MISKAYKRQGTKHINELSSGLKHTAKIYMENRLALQEKVQY